MPSPRAWWEGPWGVGRVPQVQPPAEFPPAIPALPCGCLDSWSQECRGLLVGEVNWKQENMAFLSRRPGLGKQLRGCLFPSPAPQGKGVGAWLSCPALFWGSPPPGTLTLSSNSRIPELHNCCRHQNALFPTYLLFISEFVPSL